MRILISEDDLASRRFLYKVLSDYGKCDLVVDGMEALDAYLMAKKERKAYHLICLDIMMPKINGIQVLKAIRDFEKKRKIPQSDWVQVMIISVLADSDLIDQALQLGVCRYLEKPLDRDRLIKTMADLGINRLAPDELLKEIPY